MPCLAPSELITPDVAKSFGLVAERFIGARYLLHTGRQDFFPRSAEDFQDVSVGFSNTTLMITYMKANNPSLSVSKVLALTASAGTVRIPDLITHDASRTVFYEIKPNSVDGRAAGQLKVAALDALYNHLDLPYRSGFEWSPDERIDIFSGPLFGRQVRGTFHFFRKSAGLVLYEICIDGDLTGLAFAVIVAIALAIVAIVVGQGRGRGRVPVPAFT